MAYKIKVRRGNLVDLPTLDEGELGLALDANNLYVGDDGGNILINPIKLASDGYTLDGYLYPAVDNVHGLGSLSNRWKNVVVGPGSLHVVSRASETGGTAYDWTVGINNSGKLFFDVGGLIPLSIGSDITSINNIGISNDLSVGGIIENTVLQNALDGYITAAQGADGYIAFFTSSGAIAGDNDLFYDRATSTLRIGGASSVDLNGGRLTLDADGDTYIQNSTDDVIDFYSSGALRFRISSTQAQTNGADFVIGAGKVLKGQSATQVDLDDADGRLTILNSAGTSSGYITTEDSSNNLKLFGSGGIIADGNLRVTDAIENTALQNILDGYITAAQGADGYIAFFTGPGAIAGDNDLFYDRATSTLRIGGASRIDLDGSRLILDADGDTYMTSEVADDVISFYIGGSEQARLTGTGLNVNYGVGEIGASDMYSATGTRIRLDNANGRLAIYTTDDSSTCYISTEQGSNNMKLSGAGGIDAYAGSVKSLSVIDTGDGYSAVGITGQIYSTIASTITTIGTEENINLNASNSFVVDLESAGGDVTLTLSNGAAGASYIIKIIQDSASAVDVVWPATVLWPDGITPVISTGANAVDIVTLFYDGANYYASIAQNFS